MSARDVLALAEAYGVRVDVEGDGLRLMADHAPPLEVRDALKNNKRDIIAFLSAENGWDDQDWRDYFDERAAILEFDGGYDRAEAEATAYEACIQKWFSDHPITSAPGACAWCGASENHGPVIIPFDADGLRVWLHHACWRGWQQKRRSEAVDALAAMGLALK